jgi:hypothetical protein
VLRPCTRCSRARPAALGLAPVPVTSSPRTTQTASLSTATDPKTPGQAFAAAYREHGTRARVDFDATITDQFPGFKRRPRIAMRALFKVVPAGQSEVRYWFEAHPAAGTRAVRDEALRPESGLIPPRAVALRATSAWVR